MTVQSVERAMAILRCVAGADAVGVSQIADRSGLPKSTVSRLLSTLHDLGAVAPTADGYRIGPLIGELASGDCGRSGLVAAARPILAQLVATLGEDAGVSVLDDGRVLYLEQVSADSDVQLRDWTGERVAPHCVSSGLVLLAHAAPTEQRRVLDGPLLRLTAATMVSRSKLRRRLAAVAARDSEWVFGEFADDINSVAAPVLDGDDRAVAAVHVHGPSYRFPGDRDRDEIAARIAAAAQRRATELRGSDVDERDVRAPVHRRARRRRHVG